MRILPDSSWQPVLQRAVDAFYEGRLVEGRDACLVLLSDPGLPAPVRELTYRNQTFYAQPLSEVVTGSTWKEQEAAGRRRNPNPVWTGEQLLVLLGDQPAGAELLTLDDELRVAGRHTIDVESDENGSFSQFRLFFTDRLQAAVVIQPIEEGGHALVGTVDLVAGAWRNLRRFGPRAGDFQRGWSPLVTESGAHFVAWWEPTEVFRLDEENDIFERVALRMAPHVAERFEGGSQGVAVPGGYLFLVNERVSFDEGPPLVFSRFVRIDGTFQIDAISPQFFVANRGRDEASGLTRQGERLVAGFSSGDEQALLAILEIDSVLAALEPIALPGRHRPDPSYANR
jgi:hypothetical protein